MRQRRALGEAGRARGVLDVDRVVGARASAIRSAQPLGVDAGAARRPASSQLGSPMSTTSVSSGHSPRTCSTIAAVVASVLCATALTSSRMPGLVDDVGQLVAAVGRVDVDQDRADLRRGVLHAAPTPAQFGDQMPTRSPLAMPVARAGPGRPRRRRRPARRRSTGGRSATSTSASRSANRATVRSRLSPIVSPEQRDARTCRSCTTGALAVTSSSVVTAGVSTSSLPAGARAARHRAGADYRRARGHPLVPPLRPRAGASPTTSAARSDDQLRALVRRRPDLARPAPVRPHLARGAGRHPGQRAAGARRPRPRATCRSSRPSSSAATPSTSARAAALLGRGRPAAMEPLRRRPCGRRPCSGAAPTGCTWCAPSPRCSGRTRPGSGPSSSSCAGPSRPATRPARRSTPWWRRPRRDARAILDRLTWGPAGRRVLGTPGPTATAGAWLLAHQLISPLSADHVVVPREVALRLRGGRLHRRLDLEPPPLELTTHTRRLGRRRRRRAGHRPARPGRRARRRLGAPPAARAARRWPGRPRPPAAGHPLDVDAGPCRLRRRDRLRRRAGRRRRLAGAGVGADAGVRRVAAAALGRPVGGAGVGLAGAPAARRTWSGTTPTGGSGTVNALEQPTCCGRRPASCAATCCASSPTCRRAGARPGRGPRPRASGGAGPCAAAGDRRRGRDRRAARGRVARRHRPRRAQRGRPGPGGRRPRGTRDVRAAATAMASPPALARRARPAAGRPHRRRPRAARGQPGAVHAARRRRRVPRRRHRLPLLPREPAPGPGRRVVRPRRS